MNLVMQFIDFILVRRSSGAPARIVCAAACMVMLLSGMADTPDAQTTGTSRTPAAVDPKIYSFYVGQYELAPDFIITISKENNRLFAQATGQAKVEIFPESKTKFFYYIVDAQITFVSDEKGKVIKLILHQNGRDMPATKISEKVPQTRLVIDVDPKIYDAYVGRYELSPDFILTISKENGHLYAQATGQEKAEIFPESPEKFYYTIVDAQITFIKNDKGVVTELVLHQRGDHHAMRIK